MSIPESLTKKSIRVFGPPPPKDAPKVEAWEYVRRIYIRLIPFTVPMWVVVAIYGQTWLWIVLGIGALSWLQRFISVNLQIKRLRNVPPDG